MQTSDLQHKLDWIKLLESYYKMSNKKLGQFPLIHSLSLIPKNKKIHTLWDATLGFGGDSLLLYVYALRNNIKLCSFERDPVLFPLCLQAFEQLTQNFPVIEDTWKIYSGSCIDSIFSHLHLPSLIYYDPMYPKHVKKTKSSKEMELLKLLVRNDDEEFEKRDKIEFIEKALTLCEIGILCKKSKKSGGYHPNLLSKSFPYESSVFDFYQSLSLKR